MEDNRFEYEDNALIRYNGDGNDEAVIPDGIGEIAEYAFAGCEELRRIIVPSGVKNIGQKAFWGCSGLREIVLPEGLEELGRFAFWECGSLESIIIPEGVKNIGNSAFRGCDMLRRVSLPDSVKNIGESAFSDCVSLEEINIPKGLTIIKKRVFSDCQGLVSICVPDSVTELDDYSFECCGNLRQIILPDSLKTIGRHSFSGCSSLKEICVPAGVTDIGSSAFYKTPLIDDFSGDYVTVGDGILIQYKGNGDSAVVPDNVKIIGERAFAYCEDLKKVIIPEGVIEVRDYAFEHCTALESVCLPHSLRRLGSRVFVDCAEFAEISLPDDLTDIGSDVFYGTRLLGDNTDDMMICNDKYLIQYTGQSEEFHVPDNITVIAEGAFTGCDSLKTVTIGKNVSVIGNGAFKWCGELTNVHIPGSVKYIGNEAFANSEKLHAYIECSEIFIGENAFVQGAKITFLSDERSFSAMLVGDISDNGCEQILFKFAASPSWELFDRLEQAIYKIPAAVCFADKDKKYIDYIRENIRESVCYAVDCEDTELLNKILSFGFLSEKDAEFCANYAIENKRLEQQIAIMRFKQESFGSKDRENMIDSRFEL